MAAIDTILRKTTLGDLRDWAGEAVLNRGKGYVERVEQLSRTQDNALVAWVTGGDEYATLARVLGHGSFEHTCTCPYSMGPCKHAVAVILAAAQHIKRKQEIPLLDEEELIEGLRKSHKAKRRLMGVLDNLEAKKLVD